MKPEWVDSRDDPRTIDLSDEDEKIASDYIEWLYSGFLPIKPSKYTTDTQETMAEFVEKIYVQLAEAYVFGEKIVDIGYKNVVVETVLTVNGLNKFNMGPKSVKIIYNGTSSGSPLRRFIAECMAYQAHDDSKEGTGWMDFIDGYPREALKDAMKIMIVVRPRMHHSQTLESLLEKEK